jgi:predicted HNH restriction endonuclease
MKKCLKCQADLPNWIKIDGKSHNIQGRKFCLDCSPFKAHNTSNLLIHSLDENDIKKCPMCQKEKTLSEFYKRREHTRKQHSPYCKTCSNNMTVERQRNVKQKAVDYLGGKCSICDYNKYTGALEFHHIDPAEKDFTIAQLKLTSFERIKTELDKCLLLCANCHREIHAGITEIPPKN